MNKSFLEAVLLKFSLPYELTTITDEAIEAWWGLFSGESKLLFHEAVRLSVLESDRFPTPAVVKRKLDLLKSNSDENIADVYTEIFRAVAAFGYYQEQKALASMSGIAQGICKAIGWQIICTTPTDQIAVLRAQMRGLFESLQNKTKVNSQQNEAFKLPAGIELPIKTIGGAIR